MVELVTHWDQSSTDPEIRRLPQLQAAQIESDGKHVREDSIRGLVRQRKAEKDGSELGAGSQKIVS